jgi:hypothetical protein
MIKLLESIPALPLTIRATRGLLTWLLVWQVALTVWVLV